jgi:hypothetical protein
MQQRNSVRDGTALVFSDILTSAFAAPVVFLSFATSY